MFSSSTLEHFFRFTIADVLNPKLIIESNKTVYDNMTTYLPKPSIPRLLVRIGIVIKGIIRSIKLMNENEKNKDKKFLIIFFDFGHCNYVWGKN